jgi:hypothetical protein
MHPKYSALIFVSLLILNLTVAIVGITLNFLTLEPALWAAAIYGAACAAICPMYVRHQRRNLHRYSANTPCYDKKIPAGTRLQFSGYHSSLGSWYSAIRIEH